MDRLLERDTLLLLAGNALPLLGALFAGWDAFVLIVLYWLETAVIGIWVCVRVATATPEALSEFRDRNGRSVRPGIGLALFILVHAGIFMAVHFGFIWTLFSDGWPARLSGPADFVSVLIVGTGLWLPLLGLFAVRGVLIMSDGHAGHRAEPVILGFYVRIFVMQLTILIGAWIAMLLGSIGGLVLLVGLKTAADLLSGLILTRVQVALAEAAARHDG